LRRITRIPGVGNIRSNIMLNCIKSSTELPLSQLSKNPSPQGEVQV
jgi:Lrp/AsnC family leucine-responsive transcriptional regulator